MLSPPSYPPQPAPPATASAVARGVEVSGTGVRSVQIADGKSLSLSLFVCCLVEKWGGGDDCKHSRVKPVGEA